MHLVKTIIIKYGRVSQTKYHNQQIYSSLKTSFISDLCVAMETRKIFFLLLCHICTKTVVSVINLLLKIFFIKFTCNWTVGTKKVISKLRNLYSSSNCLCFCVQLLLKKLFVKYDNFSGLFFIINYLIRAHFEMNLEHASFDTLSCNYCNLYMYIIMYIIYLLIYAFECGLQDSYIIGVNGH